jgi:hypothetical protein
LIAPKGRLKEEVMKKIAILLIGLILMICMIAHAAPKELEIKGKQFISQKPPFNMALPSAFRLIYSFSHENPEENSLTRAYLYIKEKKNQVEEMFIIQIADRTNPQAGPMTVPPLKPYTEKRMYVRGQQKKGEVGVDYLIQLMAWNPDASSLQPIVKKGIAIPSHWALQGQFIFIYRGEHATFIRYSKDVNSFKLKVSGEGDDWNRESISGNEKRVYETFQKTFMQMMDSIRIQHP